MNGILKGVKPLDYLATGLNVVLAALIGLENITAGAGADVAHPLDSHSWAMLPVFVLAAAPLLWRRRNVVAAIAVSVVVVAASLPAFGWVTRCGFALPLAGFFAYAVARFAGGKQYQLIGLAGIAFLEVLALVKDSSTGGLGGLVVGIPLVVVGYGLGLFVQSRATKRVTAPTLAGERVVHA